MARIDCLPLLLRRPRPFLSRPWTLMIWTVVISPYPHPRRFPLHHSRLRCHGPRPRRCTPAPPPRPSRGGMRAGTHCCILCSSIACFICTYSCTLPCSGEGRTLGGAVGGEPVARGSPVYVSRPSPSVSHLQQPLGPSRLSYLVHTVDSQCTYLLVVAS